MRKKVTEQATKTETSVSPVRAGRKTIILYSPDLNFCFSLSLLFQDRYDVYTTTNLGMLERFVDQYGADLVMMDAVPSEKILERIESLKRIRDVLPIILVYVYNARDASLDVALRNQVDSVYYKPFEVNTVSSRIDALLSG